MPDALAIAALLWVRRRAPEGSYFADGDRASGVFGVLATGFAIFAGFVIFLAFTRYDESRSGAEAEALAVVQQFETAQSLPAPIRARVPGELVCYGRSVAYQEWPRMKHGGAAETINPWGVALFRSLRIKEPKAATEQSAYDKWLDQTSDREEARRDRIHGAAGIIPASIWIVLFLTGGGGVRVHAVLRGQRGARPLPGDAHRLGNHGARRDALATQALDNPYAPGAGSIQPIAMERSLRLLDEARAG